MELEKVLEDVIDNSSVHDLLQAIAKVCQLKADHLKENWQDENTAKTWEHDANKIEAICNVILN